MYSNQIIRSEYIRFVSGVSAVSNASVESPVDKSKLDNDITRGPVVMMDVDIFLIACPFCTNRQKEKIIRALGKELLNICLSRQLNRGSLANLKR